MPKKKDFDQPSQLGVIYARYSSHAQKDVSIEQQIEVGREYAAANNIEIVGIYEDRAVTGKTDKRKDFQRMIRNAEKKQFQVVIAYKSNRIARNMLHALAYEDKLSKYGIRVAYVKEEYGDNAAGRFALRTMMNVNQFYSENLSEDVKRGMNDNARDCMITNGTLPYGYKKGEDGKWALDEMNAAIVREIFSRVANGDAFVDIADDLNGRGSKTGRRQAWGRCSFYRILHNERYTGVYIYDKIRVEDGIPQIIEKELFYKVQEILKTKKNPRGRHRENGDYLLTGKLFCGKCKSHMIGVSGTSKTGQLHYYYICQKKRTEKTCDKTTVQREWAEKAIAAAIKDYILQDDVITWIADITIDYARSQKKKSIIAALEDQLAANKKATNNMLAAIEQGIITAATKDRLLELEAEQSKLTAKLAVEHAEIPQVSREEIIAWLESFRDGDVDSKLFQKKLIDAFLIAVYLYDDHLKVVFNFTGKKNSVTINFDIATVDKDSGPDSSYKVCGGSPKQKSP